MTTSSVNGTTETTTLIPSGANTQPERIHRRKGTCRIARRAAALILAIAISLLAAEGTTHRFPLQVARLRARAAAAARFAGPLTSKSVEEMQKLKNVDRRSDLLASARSLCESFAAKAPLDDVLRNFSFEDDVVCLEHGLGILAPFLGREFRGRSGVREYFEMIAELLTYEDMSFSGYAVDADEGLVSVVGKATFTWKNTGSSWDEVFTYRLQFDEDAKVKVYEVWADSGAAYLASKGELS